MRSSASVGWGVSSQSPAMGLVQGDGALAAQRPPAGDGGVAGGDAQPAFQAPGFPLQVRRMAPDRHQYVGHTFLRILGGVRQHPLHDAVDHGAVIVQHGGQPGLGVTAEQRQQLLVIDSVQVGFLLCWALHPSRRPTGAKSHA